MTDGKPGKLEAFRGFIARLSEIESPDDLDNEKKDSFTNTLCLGDRDFFDHVAVKTRTKGAGGPAAEERSVVFHLLRRFEMKFEVRSETLVGSIEARLRPYVGNLGDEAGVRERLIGVFFERLGSGETSLDESGLDTMFREAGLMPDRIRNVGRLARTLIGSMRRRSAPLKYRREYDVRDVPRWPGTKPVLLIEGESGAGKSWQLARLMEERAGEGEPVVFVGVDGRAEDILKRAAREIWQVASADPHHRARPPPTRAVHKPLFTTTTVSLATTAAPVHAYARSAPARLSDDEGAM